MGILIILLLCTVAMIWSANHLITGATSIALYYRWPPFIIACTLIAFITTLPEIITAISAISKRAMEDPIGSNIANIGLVLGVIAILRPATLHSPLIRQGYLLIFLILLFTYSLMLDGFLSVVDGCILLVGYIALLGFLVYSARTPPNKNRVRKHLHNALLAKRTMKANALSLAIGCIVLPLSAYFFICQLLHGFHRLGLTESALGLSVLALCTTLPELITSIIAVMKGEDNTAIGIILGSTVFNLLALIAFPGIITPSTVNALIIWRDIPVMLIMVGVFLFLNYYYQHKVSQWHGGLLLLIYGCYIISHMVRGF